MRLLICGDFACHSGFARVNESIAHELRALGWEISVLAVNYDGDPTPLTEHYRLYAAAARGDVMGLRRVAYVVEQETPDVVLVVNDPWIIRHYLDALDGRSVPVVGYIPVDGTGLRRRDVEPLNLLSHAIAYAQFGLDALRASGLEVEASIIPHGIDLDTFAPMEQQQARRRAKLDGDVFAVLILDRNQARKRLDIAFDAFAQFARGKPPTVKLIYHGAISDEMRNGWAIEDMAADLGIADRLILTTPGIRAKRGVATRDLPSIYSMADVRLSTSSGEGWSLPAMEAMACGLPNILPRNSAVAEWAAGAAYFVDCPVATRHCGGINTVGSVPLASDVATALDDIYHHPHLRQELRGRGFELTGRDCYRWSSIAAQFDQVLRAVTEGVAV